MKNNNGGRSVVQVSTELGTKPRTTWELKSAYSFGILNDKTTTQKRGSLSMGFNSSFNHKIKLFKRMLVKEAGVTLFKYLDTKKNLTYIMPIKMSMKMQNNIPLTKVCLRYT